MFASSHDKYRNINNRSFLWQKQTRSIYLAFTSSNDGYLPAVKLPPIHYLYNQLKSNIKVKLRDRYELRTSSKRGRFPGFRLSGVFPACSVSRGELKINSALLTEWNGHVWPQKVGHDFRFEDDFGCSSSRRHATRTSGTLCGPKPAEWGFCLLSARLISASAVATTQI